VVRERSAKPLYVGSIPTRASNRPDRSFAGLRISPAKRLKFDSDRRLQIYSFSCMKLLALTVVQAV
jgi:hypothetical protein